MDPRTPERPPQFIERANLGPQLLGQAIRIHRHGSLRQKGKRSRVKRKSTGTSQKVSDYQVHLPVLRKSLPPALDKRVRGLRLAFADVCPWSQEQWVESFLEDFNPGYQVSLWEAIAAAYQASIKRHVKIEEKEEIFRLLILTLSGESSDVPFKYLNPQEQSQIASFFRTEWSKRKAQYEGG